MKWLSKSFQDRPGALSCVKVIKAAACPEVTQVALTMIQRIVCGSHLSLIDVLGLLISLLY